MTRAVSVCLFVSLALVAGVRPAIAGSGSDTCAAPIVINGGIGGTSNGATSEPLPLDEGRWAVVDDALTASVPIHCWSLNVSAGTYVWAYVEPRFGNATTGDTVVTLRSRSNIVLLPPGVVEEDDNDGNYLGSSIAGRLFTRASEVFVQVSSKNGPLSYRLHVFLTRGDLNGFTGQAPRVRPSSQQGQDLLTPGKAYGWLASSTTPDPGGFWFVNLREGERIAVMVDGSPMTVSGTTASRSPNAPPLIVNVYREGSVTPWISASNVPESNPSSLAFAFDVPSGGGNMVMYLQTVTPGFPITILAARVGATFAFDHTDLALSLASKTEPALQDNAFTLTYNITNQASYAAVGFALRVTPLSANYFVEGNSSACVDDPAWAGAVRCPLSSFAPGETKTVKMTSYASSGPTVATWNFPAAIVSTGLPGPVATLDVAPENDTLLTTVQAAPSIPISISGIGGNARPGDPAAVHAIVKNSSVVSPTSGAIGYTLNVNFPAPLTLSSVTPPLGVTVNCTGTGQHRTCTGSLAKAQTQDLVFTFGGTAGLPPGTVLPVSFQVAPVAPAVDWSAGDDATTAFAGILAMQPTATDTDGDGMSDEDELKWGLNPNDPNGDNGPAGDPDHDGIPNATEIRNGTHPRGTSQLYFAEGSTGAFFDERIAIFNPGTITARILITYLRPVPAPPVTQYLTLDAHTRTTIDLETIPGLESTAVSTAIDSDQRLVADRTMSWDSTAYGAHAETAVPSPRTTWYFAEGSTNAGFNLFYLLQNAGATAANVTVKYLRPAPAPPLTKTYRVDPQSRQNIWVNTEGPELASTDVSAVITSDVPIIAERAMYLDRNGQLFTGGHDAVGIAEPRSIWYLAEGATGPFFDLFVLLANPGDVDVHAQVKFLKSDGTVITKTKTVPANSRFNIWVDLEDPALENTAVSTIVTGLDGDLLVERAMWWPGTFDQWTEGNDSAGAVQTGPKWALAEGEVGGARNTVTYILVANPGSNDINVSATMYPEGGTPVNKVFAVRANSRFNIDVGFEFPAMRNQRFAAVVESVGNSAAIIVERAMYWDSGGMMWAAGTNALATIVP